MRESDSVAVYFLNAMLHALRDTPAERDAQLRAVGIAPQLLDQPQARVPA
ncbi:AraC family transcriptional regulator, partial [Enterococcus faecium]